MKSHPRRTLPQIVAAYANAVGRHGPNSPEAQRIRTEHAGNAEFLEYADALDDVKRALGGRGMKAEGREGDDV